MSKHYLIFAEHKFALNLIYIASFLLFNLMNRADRARPRVVLVSIALYANGNHICQAVQVKYVLSIPVYVTYHLLFDLLADHCLALILFPFSFLYLAQVSNLKI